MASRIEGVKEMIRTKHRAEINKAET